MVTMFWVVREYSHLTNDSGIISWTAPEVDFLEGYDSYQAAWRKVSRLRRFRLQYERDSTEPIMESFQFSVRRVITEPAKCAACDREVAHPYIVAHPKRWSLPRFHGCIPRASAGPSPTLPDITLCASCIEMSQEELERLPQIRALAT